MRVLDVVLIVRAADRLDADDRQCPADDLACDAAAFLGDGMPVEAPREARRAAAVLADRSMVGRLPAG